MVALAVALVLPAGLAIGAGEPPERRPGVPVPTLGDELVELRTARSKTFERSDGLLVTKMWQRPVHFRAADGSWRAYDSTLVRDGLGTLRNRAGDVRVEVAEDAAGGVRVQDGSAWASFALRGASGRAEVSGSRARFGDALPGVTATYDVLDRGVKETLTLADAGAPSVFVFDVRAGAGLRPRVTGRGSVAFVDGSGRSRLVFGSRFMVDAAGAMSRAVRYELAADGDGWRLTVTADRSWLADRDGAWPVRLDPTAYVEPDRDCEVASGGSSGTSFCDGPLRMGVDDRAHRALLHVDLAADKSLIGHTVVAARAAPSAARSSRGPRSSRAMRTGGSTSGSAGWRRRGSTGRSPTAACC